MDIRDKQMDSRAPFVEMIRRPSVHPTQAMPFAARSVGHRLADAGYRSRKKPGEAYVELFWCTKGEGYFHEDGTEYTVSPGQVFFILPDRFRFYGTRNGGWGLRWLTFDGDLCEQIFQSFEKSNLPRDVGPCPEDDFDLLAAHLTQLTPDAERMASSQAYHIFMHALGHTSTARLANPRTETARSLIVENLSDPCLNVDWLAKRLNLDRSAFSRLFKRGHQIPPSEYITKLRIQKAIGLLEETQLPVATIARECGYGDPYYFSRLFNRQMGESPRAFRRSK